MRALSLYLPTWSIDRLRRRHSRLHSPGRSAVLMVKPDHGRELVVNCCERARDAGVHGGMTVAHARALLHGLEVRVEPDRPERDRAALEALARWAVRVAPIVSVDEPDGLLMDVTGCARLYRGEARLAARLGEAMGRFGVRARLAIAPSFGAAWACARFAEAPVTRLDEADVPAALSPLPVSALRIDAEAAAGLASVGVDRVGQLLDLPRGQLAERFGEDLPRRIDQALGRRVEMIEPVRVAPRPRVERVFDGPVKQLEAIERTVRGLVEDLSAKLRGLESGARELRLRLDRADAEPVVEMLRLGHPSRDAKHLWALLRPGVERLNLGHGVDAVSLAAVSVSRVVQSQRHLANEKERAAPADDAEVGRLVDLLAGRLGPDRVLWAEPVDTHVPEKAWRMQGAKGPRGQGIKGPRRQEIETSGESGRHLVPWSPGPLASARPTVLLERAEPVEVTLMRPEGPVLMLHSGEAQRVVTTIGPERIALRWGRSTLPGQAVPERDYYRLQLEDGRWMWAFCESGTGRWFLQGMWS